MKKLLISIVVILALIAACKSSKKPRTTPRDFGPMRATRELRAVWIATVDNIDWPSRKNLTPEEQRAEFINLLNAHQRTGINAVFVQVRAAGDAFYAKSPEPWSEWLTGKQGKAPEPFYDPLEFMVEACHERGMEFHAWLNLNRTVHKASKSIADDNIGRKRPDWVFEYDGYQLFNFGLPEVRQFITDVTTNLVKNYDIDGIHFDDYFYPYTVKGQTIKDDEAFRKYGSRFKNKDDWRRNNIDVLIKQIGEAIAAEKSYVKFGVSPFGVWRNQKDDPTGSATEGGQTSYDNLYADTKKWMKEGWIDYMLPQVYFTQSFDKVPFNTLVEWWTNHTYGRHLYIGHGAYRVGSQDRDKAWLNPSELPNQIRFIRGFPNVHGSVFFSSKSLINNKLGHADSLRNDLYKIKALPPTMPWKDKTSPNPPQHLSVSVVGKAVNIEWSAPKTDSRDNDPVRYYAIYRQAQNERIPKMLTICPASRTKATDQTTLAGHTYTYGITALDRLYNESEAIYEKVSTKNTLRASNKD
ncbi:MAG: family 10 glycosylhydrolase [Runella sp.]